MIAQASWNLLCCLMRANFGWADFNFRLGRRQSQPVGLSYLFVELKWPPDLLIMDPFAIYLLHSTTFFPFLLS